MRKTRTPGARTSRALEKDI